MKPATKYLLPLVLLVLISCKRAKQDTTFTYSCRSIYQQDPFNTIIKDTTLFNITARQANDYARATSVNGWYTTCER